MVEALKWKRLESGVYISECDRFLITRRKSMRSGYWDLYDSWLPNNPLLPSPLGERGFRDAERTYKVCKTSAETYARQRHLYPRERFYENHFTQTTNLYTCLTSRCPVCGAPWVSVGDISTIPPPGKVMMLLYDCGGGWNCSYEGSSVNLRNWIATGHCPKPAQAALLGLPMNTPLGVLQDALKEQGLLPMEVANG